MKPTVAGGYKNLRGQRVRFGPLSGTVITHLRGNTWRVVLDNGMRITLARREFVVEKAC